MIAERPPLIALLLRVIGRWLLRRRYVIEVRGLEAVRAKGHSGILFLPNHPALIDPVILLSILHRDFQPVVLADLDRLQGRWLATLARWFNALPIPDPTRHGSAIRPEVEQALAECARLLKSGRNLILYPSGRLQRSRREAVGGNSGAALVLQRCPEARVVLVRTVGLWGSLFSWARGRVPSLAEGFKTAFHAALASFLFFMPRRKVTVTFEEPETPLPREDKRLLNRALEAFYNAETPPNTYVPYTPFERGGTRVLPEPVNPGAEPPNPDDIPPAVREAVLRKLEELTGTSVSTIRDEMDLAQDLAMDSLALMEFVAWIEETFSLTVEKAETLRTVGDLLLAAAGLRTESVSEPVPPAPPAWFEPKRLHPPALPEGDTIPELFFRRAWRDPSLWMAADAVSGIRTYRELAIGVSLLAGRIASWEEERIGILLPASVAAATTFLAVQSAGKIPVMANWTVGLGPMRQALERVGVRRILTSRRFWERLGTSGGEELSAIEARLVFLEDLRDSFSAYQKGRAWLRSMGFRPPRPRTVHATAVILFTSGSESRPKAVPLTHANILCNLRDVLTRLPIRPTDVLFGHLPPFHSYGLSTTVVLPLCAGAPCVYHPNPTDGRGSAGMAAAYGATVIPTTPTFLAAMLRGAGEEALRSLRLAITGAEKCPETLYAAFERQCHQATLLEGYGITECSPIVSLNDEQDNRPGTIGKVLPSLEWARKDPETDAPAPPDRPGLLLVRGPSVFSGYLDEPSASPFLEWQGRRWYNTGDLVIEQPGGVLQFAGRLKRFVKLGGEMISLPAIEETLQTAFASPGGEPAPLAVEAQPVELNPPLVLFVEGDRSITREVANAALRRAGLSPLHAISSVIALETLPRLGSGKVDYRALRALLESRKQAP